MKWSLERKIGMGFGLALLTLILGGVVSYRSTMRLITASDRVAHTHEVRAELEGALSGVENAETSQRGYIITGDDSYLETYEAAVSGVYQHLQHVRDLTKDDPNQQRQVASLSTSINKRLEFLKAVLDARKSEGFEAARQVVLAGRGKRMMHQIRKTVAEIENEEHTQLNGRVQEDEASARNSILVVSAFTILAVLFLGTSLFLIRRDIAGRRRAQQELDRFFTLSLDMLCIAGMDGYFKRLNPAWEETLGFTAQELLARPYVDFVHPEDRESTIAEAKKLTTGLDTVSFENRYLCKDGLFRWLLWKATPLAGGKLIYAAARDISERKQMEGALEAARERLEIRVLERTAELAKTNEQLRTEIAERERAQMESARLSRHIQLLLNSTGEGIYGVDLNGNATFVNRAAGHILGWAPEELLGKPLHAVMHHSKPDGTPYPREACPIYAAFKDGSVRRVTDEVFWRKDGNSVPVEYTSTPIRTEDGGLIGAVVTFDDISDRKRLEAQFLQAQKMEAVGRLAGGVAHDFNNLLTIINGYGQLLLERLEPNNPLQGHASEIMKAGERAASLTRQLLAFSRQQVLQLQVLDLNAVVTNVEKMLRRLIGEDIELRTVLNRELGRVKADAGQLEQVIMNLAVNARDAMPQGGKLTIETASVELDESYVRSHADVKPGRYVMLAVTDTGIGMEKETQALIFEPFFTTKEKGKGTGLGLATVYGIVKQSGGDIWVYSEPGRGTSFKIYMPRVEETVEAVELGKPLAKRPTAQETVLLVEDEVGVRSLLHGVLTSGGYTVLEGRRGEEALRIAELHQGPIHLILTDVVMPGMSGRELAERLKASRPEMKVLYMSGYTDDAIVHHGVLDPGMAFLQKPFTPDALARKVREVLDAG